MLAEDNKTDFLTMLFIINSISILNIEPEKSMVSFDSHYSFQMSTLRPLGGHDSQPNPEYSYYIWVVHLPQLSCPVITTTIATTMSIITVVNKHDICPELHLILTKCPLLYSFYR